MKGIKIQEEHRIIDLNEIMGAKPKPKYDETMIKMKVPRRPKWDSKTTPEQLNQMENENFLTWRRELAHLEEELLIDKTMTPFEKNIEVWKQLWRVIEKSDIVVQVNRIAYSYSRLSMEEIHYSLDVQISKST